MRLRAGKAPWEGGGSPARPPRKLGGSAPPPGLQGASSPRRRLPGIGRLGWQERLDPLRLPPRSPRPPCRHWGGGGLSFPGDLAPKAPQLGGWDRRGTGNQVPGKFPDPGCKQLVNPTRISKKCGATPLSLNLEAPGGSAPGYPLLARARPRFGSLGTRAASSSLGPGSSGVGAAERVEQDPASRARRAPPALSRWEM